MKPIDIIIIILAVGTVLAVVAQSVWKKKNGKGGCDCGCGGCTGCPSASSCPSMQKKEKNKSEDEEEGKKELQE